MSVCLSTKFYFPCNLRSLYISSDEMKRNIALLFFIFAVQAATQINILPTSPESLFQQPILIDAPLATQST